MIMCFSTRPAMAAVAPGSYEPISCARIVSEVMMGLEFTVSSASADAYSSICSPILILFNCWYLLTRSVCSFDGLEHLRAALVAAPD